MGLDIHWFKDPETIKTIKESCQKRFQDPALVDQLVDLNQQIRPIRHQYCQNRGKMKKNQQEITKIKRNKELTKEESRSLSQSFIDDNILLGQEIKKLQEQEKDLLTQIEHLRLKVIGNLVHPDVPISNSEKNNKIIKSYFFFRYKSSIS